VDLVV